MKKIKQKANATKKRLDEADSALIEADIFLQRLQKEEEEKIREVQMEEGIKRRRRVAPSSSNIVKAKVDTGGEETEVTRREIELRKRLSSVDQRVSSFLGPLKQQTEERKESAMRDLEDKEKRNRKRLITVTKLAEKATASLVIPCPTLLCFYC